MIVILDFGSQYNQLIARKVRGQGVPAQILPFDAPVERIRALEPRGLILSGGPASVHAEGAPRLAPEVPALGLPILGICYGMQALAHTGGGTVEPTDRREYGEAHLGDMADDPLFAGLDGQTQVWMSHRDSVVGLPAGWRSLARTANCPHAVMRHTERPWWGLQFHPEVHHTPAGETILGNFARTICGAEATWEMGAWAEQHIAALREEIGARRVVAAVSGGVDSTVMAVMLRRAVGDHLRCVFVDNGLLRLHEADEVMARTGYVKAGTKDEPLEEAWAGLGNLFFLSALLPDTSTPASEIRIWTTHPLDAVEALEAELLAAEKDRGVVGPKARSKRRNALSITELAGFTVVTTQSCGGCGGSQRTPEILGIQEELGRAFTKPELKALAADSFATALRFEFEVPAAGTTLPVFKGKLFLGPKAKAVLGKKPYVFLEQTRDLGWFSWLGEFLLMILGWLYAMVGNYGVAIILLTLTSTSQSVVKAALLSLLSPLCQKRLRLRLTYQLLTSSITNCWIVRAARVRS